jgi:pimeloyl-ACP methyl ester carboxylesterase
MPANQLLYHETYPADQPNAEWLLFIHGAGGSTRTWRRQIDDLRVRFNLLLIDLPGHGQMAKRPTDAPVYTFPAIAEQIWAVVDHLKLSASHLVGVSLGAIIALEMRELRPQQTQSVILSGPILKLSIKLRILASVSLALAKIIGYPAFYKLSARVMMPRTNHQKSREVFIKESQLLTTDEFRKWTNMYYGLHPTLQGLFNRDLKHPHLLVSGSQDHLFLDAAKAYAEKHPQHVHLEVVNHCGHVVSIEQAAIFNRLCLNFLEQQRSGTKTDTADQTAQV